MLPDFRGLRQSPNDRADLCSLKPISDKPFSSTKSFPKSTAKVALNTNNRIHAPAKDAGHDGLGAADHSFFQLWIDQPSWSPIILTDKGWKTINASSGKKVPLVLGSISSHYRRGIVIGKRFGKRSNYLMLDIDAGSRYHPKAQGLDAVLAALESIGLCRFLTVVSSDSGGLHLYFPLAGAVNAWKLGRVVHTTLTAAGVSIKQGQCELFPNKKALGSEHNGHRLPLQAGSLMLDQDWQPIGRSRAGFVRRWQVCAAGQDMAVLTQALVDPVRAVTGLNDDRGLPPISWTQLGQSNDVMRELVNYGDRVMGLKTIPELAEWVIEVAPQLTGFDQFASQESKQDLLRRDWAYRWAKSHFKNCREYAARNSLDYNAMIAAEALERLKAAVTQLNLPGKVGITNLWKQLCEISKRLFGRGFSWRFFKKHLEWVLVNIKDTACIGLSKSAEEDKNSTSTEEEKSGDTEDAKANLGGPPQLITLRWVTTLCSNVLSQFPTPLEQKGQLEATQGEEGGQETAGEPSGVIVVGTRVRVAMPGGSLDGAEATVLAVDRDVLGLPVYRLGIEHQGQAVMLPAECLQVVKTEETGLSAEAEVIRATAQQLLQVLGQASPFVGPGLWTVRKGVDIPAKDWGQLQHLIKET